MPRVLYLSFYYPPSRASGVYRARATANHLVQNGWDVTVFAAPLGFLHDVIGSVDEKLAETIDPRVRVERPWQSQISFTADVRRFGWWHRHMPTLTLAVYEAAQRIFPERYNSWGLAAVAKALRLHARKRFDVVVATGNPFAAFAAAWLFHRLTGVPYLVDYRDAWTLNLFEDKPAFPPGHPFWGWERRVLSRASAAVFVNDALRQWHADRYPDEASKMMIVPNGWDPDVLTETSGTTEPPAGRPLRFTYVGTVTPVQPVREMAEAFQRARSHPLIADAELNLFGHLGFFKFHHRDLAHVLDIDQDNRIGGADTGVHYRGPVSKTEIGHTYAQSDVLVFLAGGAKYVTSGKVFEYMATGKPIVSVHAPGIAAAEVLAGYPLWFNADSLDPEDIAQTMIAAGKAAADLTPQVRAQARRHAEQYSRDRVLVPFEQTLRSITAK